MENLKNAPLCSYIQPLMKKWKYILAVCFALLLGLLLAVSANAAIRGDVDGDENVTSADARLALRAAVGLEFFYGDQFTAADVDFDSVITASDARDILRVAVKLESFLIPLEDNENFSISLDHWNWYEDDMIKVILYAENKTSRWQMFYFNGVSANSCMIGHYSWDDERALLRPGQRTEILLTLYPDYQPDDFVMTPVGSVEVSGYVLTGSSGYDLENYDYLSSFHGGVIDTRYTDYADYIPAALRSQPSKNGLCRIGDGEHYVYAENNESFLVNCFYFRNDTDAPQIVAFEITGINDKSTLQNGAYPSGSYIVHGNASIQIYQQFGYGNYSGAPYLLNRLGISPDDVQKISMNIRVLDGQTDDVLYQESMTINY